MKSFICNVEIPAMEADFEGRERTLQKIAGEIRSGHIAERSLLGLVNIERREIDATSLVDVLRAFIDTAAASQDGLAKSKDAWGNFHAEQFSLVRNLIAIREQRLRELERKRGILEEVGRHQKDAIILDRTASLRIWIEQSCHMMAMAIVAFARHVEDIRAAVASWQSLHGERADLLRRLEERNAAYAQMLALEREIRTLDEAAISGGPLKSFDDLADKLLDPFIVKLAAAATPQQRLEELARHVASILEALGDTNDEPRTFSPSEAISAAAKRIERASVNDPATLLKDVLLDQPEAATSGQPDLPDLPLDHQLRNLTALLAHVVDTALGEDVLLRRLRRHADVYEWRDYLRCYPGGSAAEDANQAIAQMDSAAFESAMRDGTRLAWWSYLRDFPNGAGAERAKESLSKIPPPPSGIDQLAGLAVARSPGIFLGDLTPVACRVGWGTLRINEGGEVRVLGKPCDRFIFPHAAANIAYAVPDKATRFTAIGTRIFAPETEHGTWSYQITIDGSSVFRSPALHNMPDGIPIDVSIPSGAKQLAIEIDHLGDGHYDWSVLAYPYFHLDSTSVTNNPPAAPPASG